MPTKPRRCEVWDCGDFNNLTYFCGYTGYIETYWWRREKTDDEIPTCDLCGQKLVLRMVINEDVSELQESSVETEKTKKPIQFSMYYMRKKKRV